jgi:hypothetical protein
VKLTTCVVTIPLPHDQLLLLVYLGLAQKKFCIAGKAFSVKAFRRMNGDSTFYNLLGSGVSCLRIKRLKDLEIEFLICEILSTFM